MLTDCHTHNHDTANGIVSVEPHEWAPRPGVCYSVGIHPWSTAGECDFAQVERIARHPQVVAIGETGLDTLRGAPLAQQLPLLERHARLAGQLGKPLVLHCVRAYAQVVHLHRTLHSPVPWVIHGFRGKPDVARQLAGEGLYLSYGLRFNPASVAVTPAHRQLIETDDAPVAIEEVAARVAAAAHGTQEQILALATANLRRILG